MELLQEVEEYNRRRIRLRFAMVRAPTDPDREEISVREAAGLFTEVPMYLVARVIGRENYDTSRMGINRKIRRQVERAETVVLNLFSGVNQPVSLQEVKSQLEEWTPALKSEYDSHHGAIRPIDAVSFEELYDSYEQVEMPCMLAAVKKPPRKLKARIVACGNHAQASQGGENRSRHSGGENSDASGS